MTWATRPLLPQHQLLVDHHVGKCNIHQMVLFLLFGRLLRQIWLKGKGHEQFTELLEFT